MQSVSNEVILVVDFILKQCTDAWIIHDYSTGGSSCIYHYAQLIEDYDNYEALLSEFNINCIDNECEELRKCLIDELRKIARQKEFEHEFETFNEFSKILHKKQQHIENINEFFSEISKKLYEIYKNFSANEIRQKILELMDSIKSLKLKGSTP